MQTIPFRISPYLMFFLVASFPLTGVADDAVDYGRLTRECQGDTNPGCCMKGVRKMRDGHFLVASGDKCPKGYKLNQDTCEGGKKWCEPGDPADVSVRSNNLDPFDSKKPKAGN